MILSNSKQYIFISVPKTGTHSMHRVLRKYVKPGDVVQHYHMTDVKTRFPMAQLNTDDDAEGHIPLARIAPFYDLQEFWKFGFVRNPFDRFVSFCSWIDMAFFVDDKPMRWSDDPQGFMKRVLAKVHLFTEKKPMLLPAAEFLCDESGTIAVDYVGRYETLEPDFSHVLTTLGIKSHTLPTINKSQREKDYRPYYTTALVDKVAEFYKRDIQLFGYKFE